MERLAKPPANDFDDPVVLSPSQLASSSKISRSFSTYLDRARRNPIFITREQDVEAVLLSLDAYRQLVRAAQELEELHWAVLAVRRIAEHLAAPKPLADTDEVLARFGLTRAELEANKDEGEDVEG